MSAAAEVYMCISGEGGDDDEEDEGEEKYEYDYGGMELIMDDEKAKVDFCLESSCAFCCGCCSCCGWSL